MSPEQQARYAGIINDEAQRLTRLLDDLLDLSVLENGQVVLNEQKGSLNTLLDRAVDAATTRDVPLKIFRNPTDEKVELKTDLDRLTQVFINLIANAAKYCDAETPELRISVRKLDRRTVVDFVDNGSGISKDDQGVIFEKFSRLSDDRKAGGAGLGLAICREVMARLGGDIAYLPGQNGGAFQVVLPTAKSRSKPVKFKV